MYVKPREGMIVLYPTTGRILPIEGAEVADTSIYWTRRLRDGDVERSEAPAPSGETEQ